MSRVRTLVGRTTALLLLTSGTVVAGSSSAYAADGTISGSVTAANRSITYGWVDLYAWDAVGQEFDPFDAFYISSTTTAKTFTFTVPPGSLRPRVLRLPAARASRSGRRGLPETLAQPGVLDVTDGGSVRADVAYPALHTVSGTVSGARAGESEATLWRWEPSHNHFDSFDWEETRFNWSYSFYDAPAGIYTVEFERPRSGSALGERKWLGGNASKPSAPITGTARSGDAAVARLLSSTTAKPRKKKVDVGDKVKLKVVVRVPGVAAPTGTVKVSEGKKKVARGPSLPPTRVWC